MWSYLGTKKPENTDIRGSITQYPTSCLFCLDSSALLMVNEQKFYLFGQIQTSQTGGQLYSDTYPNGECSLFKTAFYSSKINSHLRSCTKMKCKKVLFAETESYFFPNYSTLALTVFFSTKSFSHYEARSRSNTLNVVGNCKWQRSR